MIRDSDLTFFAPLWRRGLLVAVLVGWTIFEWTLGDAFWGVITMAAALYAIWTLFINFDRRVAESQASAEAKKKTEEKSEE